MISKIVELAEKLSEDRRKDPELVARMDAATQEQAPRFLLISPITRSSQDLQLFNMRRGDSFHGTRVPNEPLLPPSESPILLAGPASYNHWFPEHRGVILTFDLEEPEDVIRKTLDNIVKHPDVSGLPLIVFRVNYERGSARIIAHGKGRNYEMENWLLSQITRPDPVDSESLVLICSDSRVQPPVTPKGLPMAIQSLGGYLPRYSGSNDETYQLNDFFDNWLSKEMNDPHILIVAHGNFEGESSSCGAGEASLNPDEVPDSLLRDVILELNNAAKSYETKPPRSPEDRVKSLSSAVRENLLSYAAVRKAADTGSSDFIQILFMDTISNVLSTPED
jgi:hypothetical protein